jgi:sigma-B regulation protein RsbU (phosphoserine phosphatase)
MAARDSFQNFSEMADPLRQALRRQLEYRREVLAGAAAKTQGGQLMHLLHEVDAALGRLEGGTYGICELCHETVEDEQLLINPLVRFCLDHLGGPEQAALERDLELAAQIQARLLPKRDFHCDGWHVAYQYKALGVVSGDYCDLVIGPEEQLYFMVGDVAGKGVAASMLMANLNAIFRTLIPLGLPLAELMERANRIFTGSTLPTQFATLICGRAMPGGALELCSAGHVPALVVAKDCVSHVESHGLPIGLFSEQKFTTSAFEIETGSSLILFSDGISEARAGEEDYGYDRIATAVMRSTGKNSVEILADCVRDLELFLSGAPLFDDQTLMVVQRSNHQN